MNEMETGLDYAPKMRITTRQNASGNTSCWVESEIMGKAFRKNLRAKSMDEACEKALWAIRSEFAMLGAAHPTADLSADDVATIADKELARGFMRATTSDQLDILFAVMSGLRRSGISVSESLEAFARVDTYVKEKEEFQRKTPHQPTMT